MKHAQHGIDRPARPPGAELNAAAAKNRAVGHNCGPGVPPAVHGRNDRSWIQMLQFASCLLTTAQMTQCKPRRLPTKLESARLLANTTSIGWEPKFVDEARHRPPQLVRLRHILACQAESANCAMPFVSDVALAGNGPRSEASANSTTGTSASRYENFSLGGGDV